MGRGEAEQQRERGRRFMAVGSPGLLPSPVWRTSSVRVIGSKTLLISRLQKATRALYHHKLSNLSKSINLSKKNDTSIQLYYWSIWKFQDLTNFWFKRSQNVHRAVQIFCALPLKYLVTFTKYVDN